MKNLKKAQLALAVAVTLSAGFGATGIASAEVTYDALVTRIAALEQATGSKQSNAINTETYNKVQIGSYYNSTGYNGSTHAVASGNQSIAIGGNAEASGAWAIAMGTGIKTSERPIAAGEASIAMGTASVANGSNNIAIGNTARTGTVWTTSTSGNRKYDLKVNGHYLTEISTKDKDTSTWEEGKDYDYAVSTETTDANGTITTTTKYYNYVSAGTATEADALDDNGNLKDGYFARTTTTTKDDVTTTSTTYYTYATDYSAGSTTISVPKTANAIAIGNSVYSNNDYSVAIGNDVKVNSSGSIAIGAQQDTGTTIVNSRDSVAIGNGVIVGGDTLNDGSGTTPGDNVAIATRAEAKSGSASAYGAYAHAYGAFSAALGSYSHALANNSIAIGRGSEAAEAATSSVTIGLYSKVKGNDSVAIGSNAQTGTEQWATALGTSAKALAKGSTALGKSASVAATEGSAVALGADSEVVAGDGNVISIGNSGLNRKIIHVAQGTADTDAVNLSQVITDITYDATSGKLSFKTGANKTETWSATIAPKVDTTVDGTAGTYNALTDTQLNNFNNSVNALQDRIKALEDAKQQGTTGGVDATGDVTSGETNAVSGGNLYSELRPEDGTYVKQDNTTAGNLTALDAAVKANSDAIGAKITADGNAIKANTSVNDNLKNLDKAIGSDNDYGTAFNNISKITEETVTGDDGSITTATHTTTLKENIGALDAAIGKAEDLGTILDKDGNALNTYKDEDGDTKDTSVVDAVKAVNEKVGDLDKDAEYSNIEAGASLSDNLASLDSAVGDTSALADTIKDVDGNALTEGKQNVAGYLDAVNSKVGDLDKDAEYSNIEAGASLSDNLASLDSAVGTTKTGAYVDGTKSVGENLNALDDQVFTNTNDIARLGDRLNKVGAGAAALAALHVEEFDADNKLSFAAGFGHYKNANAGAIGAFYKPNHDTTFSVASTVGNGNTMVNAGVSFKLGKSAHVEKTMVAKADYEALQNKVAAQDERLASQDAQIEELKAQVAALVAKG